MLVNGWLNLLSAYRLIRRRCWAPLASLLAGSVLIAWIAVQWLIIGYRHWTQWMWTAIFFFQAVTAAVGVTRERLALLAHFGCEGSSGSTAESQGRTRQGP